MVKRIGILTGGGDCGGLNAVISAVTRFAIKEGWEGGEDLEGKVKNNKLVIERDD